MQIIQSCRNKCFTITSTIILTIKDEKGGTVTCTKRIKSYKTNRDKIVIGNIMLLIPEGALTNSIKDMIKGDTMSGMLRFIEAMVTAAAVSVGFVMATVYIGGVLL